MAPPYVDENPNLEMTELGLRIAENEKRDAVRDGYEEDALSSDETEESLDDISYPDGDGSDIASEISATKENPFPRLSRE